MHGADNTDKKVYIRADGNSNIGMGHIMRCLSIADSFKAKGMKPTYVIADDGFEPLIKERGFQFIVLGTAYDHMEEEMTKWSPEEGSIVLVDSYYVIDKYLRWVKSQIGESGRLVYLDDVYSFAYPVDELINYNAYGESEDYKKIYANAGVPSPKLILGLGYAPLRTMFRGIEKRLQPQQVKNVLVSTGGSDPLHLALRITKYLKSNPSEYNFHILLGKMNQDKEEIQRNVGENVVLHENVVDMKSLISSCDIAVSAAGSTMYEIFSCGVPFITYSTADNQIFGAECLDKKGIAHNCGDFRLIESPETIIINAVEKLAADYDRRVRVGAKMQELVDGYGADKIVEEIITY